MKTIIALAAVLLIGLALFAYKGRSPGEAQYQTPSTGYTTPDTGTPPAGGSTSSADGMVRNVSLKSGDAIKSPLVITGEARGGWYFEASFPIKVLDAKGAVLGQAPAQAQGEWMTSEFVAFKATVPFSTPTTPTGTVVIHNDNPSGLPENDRELRIPVTFSQANTQTKTIKLYFYNSDLDKDASGNVLCSAKGLVAVNRVVPLTNTPIQDAVKELLKGPVASDSAGIKGTEFPLPGVTLTSASLSNSVLSLTFSDPQNKTGGGSCRVAVLKAQIEATAKQFGGVSSVRFLPATLFQP